MAEVKEVLFSWFSEHKRDLPWRNTIDPYLVWVSEIILQQTQVKQGLPYYERFVYAFPNVKSLAEAPEDKVLKMWQGLGYYSRARNMHFSAKYIVGEFKGVFPSTYSDIIKLKGVGEYTGAAIASFCFNEVVPVVDGNVYRFISRYFGIDKPIDELVTKKEIRSICEEIISKDQPDEFNQAIMEFGALQCKPKQVDCSVCPFQDSCWAFKNDRVSDLPFKAKKIKKRTRYFYYLLLENNEEVIIRKRTGKDIWEGLYEFPFFEESGSISENEVLSKIGVDDVVVKNISEYKKHLLSHQTIHAKFFHLSIDEKQFEVLKNENNGIVHPIGEIHQFAFPKLIENYLLDREI